MKFTEIKETVIIECENETQRDLVIKILSEYGIVFASDSFQQIDKFDDFPDIELFSDRTFQDVNIDCVDYSRYEIIPAIDFITSNTTSSI